MTKLRNNKLTGLSGTAVQVIRSQGFGIHPTDRCDPLWWKCRGHESHRCRMALLELERRELREPAAAATTGRLACWCVQTLLRYLPLAQPSNRAPAGATRPTNRGDRSAHPNGLKERRIISQQH